MKQIISMLTGIFLVSICLACSDRLTPWATELPEEFRDLTARQLALLNDPQQLPFTFAVLADPQTRPDDFEKIVDAINREEGVSFALVLGDITDYGLLHEYIWAGDALKRFKIPYFTAIGNHDAIAHGKKIYERMFGPLNYTFEFGTLRFVMFNNNQYEFGETDFDWLEENVTKDAIVSSHVPAVVDMHSPEQIERWTTINSNADVLLSLHGHRGTSKGFYWVKKGVPYYVIARARDVRYALITVTEKRSIIIKPCHNSCEATP